MKIDIVAIEDENFKIKVGKFGDSFLASDGERLCINASEDGAITGVEALQHGIDPTDRTSAPLENSRSGHPFDPFGGTSWAGKPQGFN